MNSTVAALLDSCGRPIIPGAPLPPTHPIRLVEGICYPFLLVLCTVGNVLNMIVLTGNQPKTTADIYMISLAVSDVITLWIYMPMWTTKIQPSLMVNNTDFASFYLYYNGLYPGFGTIFYFISNWIVVIFSLERLLVVLKPMYFLGRFNVKTAVLAVCFIVLVAIVKSLEVFIEYFSWLSTKQPPSKWISIRDSTYPWLSKWSPVQGIFTIVDPIVCFVILFTTNTILAVHLIRRHNTKKEKLQVGQKQSQGNSYIGTVILSMGCACLYLVCKTPSLVYNALLLAYLPPFCTYYMSSFDQMHWLAFVWLFSTINYSVNFYLYCAISNRFRLQLKARFPGMAKRLERTKDMFRSKKDLSANTTASPRGSMPITDSTDCGSR